MADATETTQNVEQIAQRIAQEIVTRSGGGNVATFDAADLTSLTGGFTLAIKYGTTTYTLTVTIPSGTGGTYVFSFTETPDGGTATTIASFKYQSASAWGVEVNVPAITIGSVTIAKLALTLGEGNPT